MIARCFSLLINGRNVFTIEYDRESKLDTVRNGLDEEVLGIQYNDAGQIIGFIPLRQNDAHLAALQIMYDASGRQNQISWANSSLIFEYDRLNRIASAAALAAGTSFLQRKFTYQKENQLIPSLIQMPSGEKYRWRTDASGAVTFLKTPAGAVQHLTQFARFAEKLLEYFYEYDDYFRLTSLTIIDNAVRLPALKYQYDSRSGQLTKLDNFVFLRDSFTRRIMGET
ncbi:unnamed protein product, partial [Gongylonema pulchrum]|uniref:SAC domain-containing protein n=1 Tax=Gongylonema pulchrum TaxID=637853 RepID=A0A183ETP4_9BILA